MFHPTKLLALGLDGLSLSQARLLAQNGYTPNLATVLDRAGSLTAHLPDLSPVNWTSFFTASPPEKHGVFGFTRIDPVSKLLDLVDFRQVVVPTLFDRLSNRGLSTVVLNMPNTAPVRPIRGAVVAGFPARDLSTSIFPLSLAGKLHASRYLIEPDFDPVAHDPERLFALLGSSLARRRTALDILWNRDWDAFFFVLTETDRLFHFHFDAVVSPCHPLHNAAMSFFHQWDVLIGELFERFDALPEPKRFLVLADHGFGPLSTEVDLNRLLYESGFLKTTAPLEPHRNELDASIIAPESWAFALDPGRILLLNDRFPGGRVKPADEPKLLKDIAALLSGLTLNGLRVMERVCTAAELGHTAETPQAPDLLALPAYGFETKAKWNRSDVFTASPRRGTHRPEDAIFYDSQGEVADAPAQVGRLVAQCFGLDEEVIS